MSNFTKTVFVLGAGVNQVMTNWVEISKQVSPPLMKDFFIVVSRLNRFSKQDYRKHIQPIYDFINEHWDLTISDLAYTSFNIEDCFSLLQSKFTEASRTGEEVRARELFSIQLSLKRLLSEVLAEFDGVERNGVMRAFGQLLFRLKPVIITFNYDCFIETVIEIASGQSDREHRGRTMEHVDLSESYWNWNLPRGYALKFDHVMMHDRFSYHPQRRRYVDGKTFYFNPRNHLYPWYLLKLHGSLNWFRYVPKEFFSPSATVDSKNDTLSLAHRSNIILGHLNLLKSENPMINKMFVDPIIITPGFNKEDQFGSAPYVRKILPLWKKAEDALAHCNNLVVIGYSFPSTDDEIRALFSRALSDNLLEELIVVNPDDMATKVASRFCKFERLVRYRDLKEILGHHFG